MMGEIISEPQHGLLAGTMIGRIWYLMKAYQVHSALHSSQEFDQLACMSGRVIETAKDDIFKTQPALVCPVSPLEHG